MDEIAVRRVGDRRHFIAGVPDRDLTQAEWEALTAEQQQIILGSFLYEAVEQSHAPEPVREPEAPHRED